MTSEVAGSSVSNEQFSRVDDSKLSQVGEYGGYLINELFMCCDESKLPEVGGSDYSSNTSLVFQKFNEKLRMVDDSEGHPISDIYWEFNLDTVFEKLSELFEWSDDDSDDLSQVDVDDDDDDDGATHVLILQAGREDVGDIDYGMHHLTCDEPVAPAREKKKPSPKREKEDYYSFYRKDATKMIGIALSYSKKKKDAKSRGDHTFAKQFNQKEQEAWKAAGKLNKEAADKILAKNNRKNGIMELDLHGLHKKEAIQAVKERLHLIETQPEALHASYPDGCDMGKRQHLQVITGVGKHSRGEPILPTAVRTSLAAQGYLVRQLRPGVIMVLPRFEPCEYEITLN